MTTDPVELTQELIRCESVTPKEAGALVLLQSKLEKAGFQCTRVDRNETSNLFARWGSKGAARSLGFNGHTDVVPVGDVGAWQKDPFGGEIAEGVLWGRGATDMKSGVAAFVSAAIDYASNASSEDRAIVITITGDEEGPAKDGTLALLDYMEQENERMTDCLVGEPTCPNTFGEMMKIGRRGSITAEFVAKGVQGHVAYPERTKNPIPALSSLVYELSNHKLDEGTRHFDPSSLEVTTFDTGNSATNIVPATCKAVLNIRFNDAHSGEQLAQWLKAKADNTAEDFGVEVEMSYSISGESFVTDPGPFVDLVANAVSNVAGIHPEYSTTGGTSDARFVKNHCPVVEFGLVGKTMHQIDERIELEQIHALKSVYSKVIEAYLK